MTSRFKIHLCVTGILKTQKYICKMIVHFRPHAVCFQLMLWWQQEFAPKQITWHCTWFENVPSLAARFLFHFLWSHFFTNQEAHFHMFNCFRFPWLEKKTNVCSPMRSILRKLTIFVLLEYSTFHWADGHLWCLITDWIRFSVRFPKQKWSRKQASMTRWV